MRDWLREPRNRSLLGALLAPVLTVLMIGVLGCLPASVGDPEHARVDERLSGAWLGTDSYEEPPPLTPARPLVQPELDFGAG